MGLDRIHPLAFHDFRTGVSDGRHHILSRPGPRRLRRTGCTPVRHCTAEVRAMRFLGAPTRSSRTLRTTAVRTTIRKLVQEHSCSLVDSKPARRRLAERTILHKQVACKTVGRALAGNMPNCVVVGCRRDYRTIGILEGMTHHTMADCMAGSKKAQRVQHTVGRTLGCIVVDCR